MQDTSDQPLAGHVVRRRLPGHRDHLEHLRHLPGDGAAHRDAPARRQLHRHADLRPAVGHPGPVPHHRPGRHLQPDCAAGRHADLEQDHGVGRPAHRRGGQPDAWASPTPPRSPAARNGCFRSPFRRARRWKSASPPPPPARPTRSISSRYLPRPTPGLRRRLPGCAGPRPVRDHPVHRAGRLLRADRGQFRADRCVTGGRTRLWWLNGIKSATSLGGLPRGSA